MSGESEPAGKIKSWGTDNEERTGKWEWKEKKQKGRNRPDQTKQKNTRDLLLASSEQLM